MKGLEREMEKEMSRIAKKNEELLVERFEAEMERGYGEIEQGVKFRTIKNMSEFRDKVEAFKSKFVPEDSEMMGRLNEFLVGKVLAHGEAVAREQEVTQEKQMKLMKARLAASEDEISKRRLELTQARETHGNNVNTLES